MHTLITRSLILSVFLALLTGCDEPLPQTPPADNTDGGVIVSEPLPDADVPEPPADPMPDYEERACAVGFTQSWTTQDGVRHFFTTYVSDELVYEPESVSRCYRYDIGLGVPTTVADVGCEPAEVTYAYGEAPRVMCGWRYEIYGEDFSPRLTYQQGSLFEYVKITY